MASTTRRTETDGVGARRARTRAAAPTPEALGGRIVTAGREIRDEVSDLAESVNTTTHAIGELLREHTRQRPYVSVGIAAGAGFILGGGLSPRVGMLLLTMGGRLLVSRLLREVIEPEA